MALVVIVRFMSSEEWRPVAGVCDEAASLYRVSSLGEVSSRGRHLTTWRTISQSTSHNGYKRVYLHYGGKRNIHRVNRLVTHAFHGGPPDGSSHACHGDGDRSNNRADNLRWATNMENSQDKMLHGTVARGSGHGMAKLDRESVLGVLACCGSQARVARHFGISATTVGQIRLGKTWSHIRGDLKPATPEATPQGGE